MDYEAISRANHAPELIEKARQTRNVNAIGKRLWSDEEVALMGQLTDAEIAQRVGCNKLTVAHERRRRGIAGTFVGHRADLPSLDPSKVRTRRLALGLTQRELGTRLGKGERRAMQLENELTTRIKPATLRQLADALECGEGDLQPHRDL